MDGALPLLLANVWHGLVGFAIYVAAARLLSKADFAALTVAVAVAMALEELVKLGLPKAVSREAARSVSRDRRARALSLGLRWNFFVAALLALGFAGASPGLAAVVGKPDAWLLFALAGVDLALFAPFTVCAAALNGERRFKQQAALMACYSTAKLAAVCGALALGRSPEAGVLGYLAGSAAGSLIGLFWLGAKARREGKAASANEVEEVPEVPPASGAMLRFSAPMALFGFMLAAFLNVDLLAFNGMMARYGGFFGDYGAPILQAAAEREAGYYSGAAHVARMAFFVFLAFGEALFPSMAKALADAVPRAGAETLRKALGRLLLMLLPATGLGLATGGEVAALIFGRGYEGAAPYLAWLLPLSGALTLFHLLASALAAAERPWTIFLAVAAALGLNVWLNFFTKIAWPTAPPFNALLAAGLGLAILAPALFREFGARWIPWLEALLGLAGAWALWRLGLAVAGSGWPVFLWGGLGFGAVWSAGEAVRKMVSRRAAAAAEA